MPEWLWIGIKWGGGILGGIIILGFLFGGSGSDVEEDVDEERDSSAEEENGELAQDQASTRDFDEDGATAYIMRSIDQTGISDEEADTQKADHILLDDILAEAGLTDLADPEERQEAKPGKKSPIAAVSDDNSSNEEIEKLKAEIETIKAERDELTENMEGSNECISALHIKKGELEKKTKSASSMINDLDQEIASLKEQNEKLQRTNFELTGNLLVYEQWRDQDITWFKNILQNHQEVSDRKVGGFFSKPHSHLSCSACRTFNKIIAKFKRREGNIHL